MNCYKEGQENTMVIEKILNHRVSKKISADRSFTHVEVQVKWAGADAEACPTWVALCKVYLYGDRLVRRYFRAQNQELTCKNIIC